MTSEEMEREILRLIAKYAPEGTKFFWDESRKHLGFCTSMRDRNSLKISSVIYISYPFAVQNTWEMVRKTVLHEIAHAIRPGHYHDKLWEYTCISIGGDGMRYASLKAALAAKYMAICPICGKPLFSHSRTGRPTYHIKCGRESLLTWGINPDAVLIKNKELLMYKVGLVRASEHTAAQIRKNIGLEGLSDQEINAWCREQIMKEEAVFELSDFKCTITTAEYIINIDASSYIVTGAKKKGKKPKKPK
ncbi:MAG: hypothetical protein IK020_00140 [Clostridiales bacterium]|nr:hypothetical protein [Clostridiales bacterium]